MLYELGEGPPVLLVHGWSGRGSQMAFIAKALAGQGFKVITFDAFAHGESPGKQTTMLEFVEIIKHISKSYPEFEAIVGHSIGAVSAAKAIKQGVKSKRLVTIGAPANAHYIVEAFSIMINGSDKVKNYLQTFLEKYTNKNLSDFSLAKISSELTIPGLIIHDAKDHDVLLSQAQLVEESWSKARLLSTKGLGHTRILRDEKVIKHILKFIKNSTYSAEKTTV